MKFGRLPVLIGLGPMRSGSTWTHELLYGHSQVATTRTKEVNFFSDHYELGSEWYRSNFTRVGRNTKLFADISPRYMFAPYLIQRVRQTVVEPLFIVGLRSPYERIRSTLNAFGPFIRVEHLRGSTLGCFDVEAFEPDRKHLLQLGVIAHTIESCRREFGMNRIVCYDIVRLRKDPATVAREIETNLGLSIELPASTTQNVRPTSAGSLPSFRRIKRMIRWVSPKSVYWLKYHILRGSATNEHVFSLPRDELVTLYRLLAPAFEDDISKLEDILGRDFSSWRIDYQIEHCQIASKAGDL